MDNNSNQIVSTGISGLDALIGGGFPRRNQALIAGGPGTGKTLMAFEILCRCAKAGMHCAYVSLEENTDDIIRNARIAFPGFGIEDIIKNRMLVVGGDSAAMKMITNVQEESSYSMGNLISEVEAIIKANNADVVAFDSVSFLKLMLGTKSLLYNRTMSSIMATFRRMNTMSVSILEIPYYSPEKVKFAQELVLFDTVLMLFKDKGARKLQVAKHRGAAHSDALSTYSISPEGVKFG